MNVGHASQSYDIYLREYYSSSLIFVMIVMIFLVINCYCDHGYDYFLIMILSIMIIFVNFIMIIIKIIFAVSYDYH